MSSRKIGAECKLYYNAGTWESPDWEEIEIARDVTLNMARAEADASIRGGGGFKQYLSGLLDSGIETEVVWDTEDTAFSALQDAFMNNTSVELAVMDGDITVAGSEGLHADFIVTQFNRTEPLEEAVKAAVTLKPALTENTPEWLTVAS